MNTLQILLSSAVIAAFVSGVVSIILKHIDFKNEYHKLILQKRIIAYDQIEKSMFMLSSCVIDDGKPLHGIFLEEKQIDNLMVTLTLVIQHRVWINPNTYTLLIELNRIIYKIQNSKNIITSAKENYNILGQLRDRLLKEAINDYKSLYSIPKDLKKHD